MKPENEMPRDVYVFNSPDSIGDMGFTVTDAREGHMKYTRADTVPTPEELAQVKTALEEIKDIVYGLLSGEISIEAGEVDSSTLHPIIKALAILEKLGV